jgi:hypothetical protein
LRLLNVDFLASSVQLKEEAQPAMPLKEVEVGIPEMATSECEAECWSDNGTENDSEWEEA